MLVEIVVRILVGGVIVSAFAILGDILQPKTFAGLFGAAPSIALATLILTISREGPHYVAIESRSMILGAIAFFLYALTAFRFFWAGKWSTFRAAFSALVVWFASAFALWLVVLR